MRYLLIPDVHANWSCLAWLIGFVRSRGIPFDEVIQVGDFGVYKGHMKKVIQMAYHLNVKIHFIDGNHEDHAYLQECKNKLAKKGIIYHPRGDVTVLPDGTKIGWCGGAYNVDRPQEYVNGTCNYPTTADIDRTADAINKVGGVDLMITHSCPPGIGVGMKGSEFFIPWIAKFVTEPLGVPQSPIDDVGDLPLFQLWQKLEVKPSQWVFGHFHTYLKKKVDNTEFYCVGVCDNHFEEFHKSLNLFFYDSGLKQVLH
jgi:hypothetical protein